MLSAITRGKATSCYSLGLQTAIARGRCGAASDWAGSCAIIIEKRRDGPLAGSVYWPYEVRSLIVIS